MIVTLLHDRFRTTSLLPSGGRNGLRQQGIGSPPFPFPPGESRGGRVPPTPEHAACQPKALARIMRRLPPQEGCRPLVHPPLAPRRVSALGRQEGDDSRPQQKDRSAVYTKYSTLPKQPKGTFL